MGMPPRHRDPIDRLLIAQAMAVDAVEGLPDGSDFAPVYF